MVRGSLAMTNKKVIIFVLVFMAILSVVSLSFQS
jgi:hypothetical protein